MCLALVGILALLGASCGGGNNFSAGLEASSQASAQDGADASRGVSDLVPRRLLPAPSSLLPRLGNHPNSALRGDEFERRLPNHRVRRSHGGALFMPGSSRGRGPGGRNGQYAYALYHVTAPECPTDGKDDDCDDVELRLSINPLYEDDGPQGENPLYVGIADFSSNSWSVKAQDYNSSRSNITAVMLDNSDFGDDDDDGDGIDSWLVAVILGPGERSPGNGHGGGRDGGALRLESMCVSRGWEVSLLDDGTRSNGFICPSSMDACVAPDGSHHVAYFTDGDGLRHVRCADGSCVSSDIPRSSGSGPSVGMGMSPKGSPYVSSFDTRRGIGPVRWMAPESLRWQSSLFFSGGHGGEAFDPRWYSDVCVTGDGSVHVVYHDPSTSSLVCSSLTSDGEWHEETVASKVRIRKRPDLLLQEWDSLVCTFQTCGDGGAVYVAQRGSGDMGWKYFPVASAPCPDGDSCGTGFSADLDDDGRLDIVCSTTKGDVAIHYSLKDRSTEVTPLGSPDDASSCVSVASSGGVMHCVLYNELSGNVRYVRKRPGRTTYSSSSVVQYPAARGGVHGHVTVLKIVLDPDDDGDGIGTASCYIMQDGSSPASGSVAHWTLEVRVNRIEMA